ncbi:MAG: bacteriocin [Capnocytophaga sp.]|nr:bacteriocin [Capnocytophaga sp.]
MKKINKKEVETLSAKELRSIEGGTFIIGNIVPLDVYPPHKRPILIRDNPPFVVKP